jgi:hypothetical protein
MLAFGTAPRDHGLRPRPVRLACVAKSAQGRRGGPIGRDRVPCPREVVPAPQKRALQLPRPSARHLGYG